MPKMSDLHEVLTAPSNVAVARYRSLPGAFGVAGEMRRAGRSLAVGAALLLGDLIASWSALTATHVFFAAAGLTGTAAQDAHLPIAALLLIFLALRLYSSSSRCPYARFRARGLGILLFVTLDGVVAGSASGLATVVFQAVISAATLLVAGTYVELFVRHILVKYGLWTAPTAIVGCGETARRLYTTLAAEAGLGFRPVGFIRTHEDEDGRGSPLPGPVLGSIDELARLGADIEVAILTSRTQLPATNAISDTVPPARLILVNDAQDIQTLRLCVRTLGQAVGIEFERDPFVRQNRILKRVIDLFIAVPAAILTLPVIAAFAAIIWFIDRGSPFFVQTRIGERGRLIKVPKLRTMYSDAARRLEEHLHNSPEARAEWERYFKLSNDPRILPMIGTFIRRSSIDELPQLWSVIVGDMSLVGPRPFPEYHMSKFDSEFQAIRTIVPPGLTGLWQVTSRSNGDLTVQRAQDLTYIRNWSVLLDLYILFQTLPAVLIAKGAK